MSTVLPRDAYRDPLQALEKKEERTCVGCVYEVRDRAGAPRCAMNMRHGERCSLYLDREVK